MAKIESFFIFGKFVEVLQEKQRWDLPKILQL